MPTFNEADGIAEFLSEISNSFMDYELSLIVVDDHSSDSTVDVLRQLKPQLKEVMVISQETNRGHGPTTLVALEAGLRLSPHVIVSTDGDGQISGLDLRVLCDSILHGESKYAEGVRISRNDPWFRRLVSATTRSLIWIRTGKIVSDANTPFRAYRPDLLRQILDSLPADSAIPNLMTSSLVRSWSTVVQEVQIESLPRRGSSKEGSTWNQKSHFLPSSRFLKFCIRAFWGWLKFTFGNRN